MAEPKRGSMDGSRRQRVAAALAMIMLAPPLGAAERRPTAPAVCRPETVATGTVKSIIDARTFVLADGREVRLAGIEVPPLPGAAAPAHIRAAATPGAAQSSHDPGLDSSLDPGLAAAAALESLIGGREVLLRHSKFVTDRYGRILADAAAAGSESPSAIKSLLAQGFARLAAHGAEPACTAELRAAERAARAAKLGLWANSRYFPKAADDPAGVLAERGRFTLVEGKVVSVRESGGTIYVNFGRRWSEDFTVTILKRNERQFTAAGLAVRSLAGRRVLVRGWIEQRGGPWIEATEPQQIEVIADK
ncbi:MAG TPA: thermonuclease family protein [Xanthobacteraceae bacterium]|nr:thermonuclease family protein [Xanthobacteraceae bacterium]